MRHIAKLALVLFTAMLAACGINPGVNAGGRPAQEMNDAQDAAVAQRDCTSDADCFDGTRCNEEFACVIPCHRDGDCTAAAPACGLPAILGDPVYGTCNTWDAGVAVVDAGTFAPDAGMEMPDAGWRDLHCDVGNPEHPLLAYVWLDQPAWYSYAAGRQGAQVQRGAVVACVDDLDVTRFDFSAFAEGEYQMDPQSPDDVTGLILPDGGRTFSHVQFNELGEAQWTDQEGWVSDDSTQHFTLRLNSAHRIAQRGWSLPFAVTLDINSNSGLPDSSQTFYLHTDAFVQVNGMTDQAATFRGEQSEHGVIVSRGSGTP